MNLKTLMLFVLALCVAGFADPAFATDLPWEDGLKTVKESLTGPVATALAIIGMVGAGAMLIFGGEISGFLKSVCYMVLVVAFLISGSSLLEVFTGKKDNATGAVITYVVPDHHVIALS